MVTSGHHVRSMRQTYAERMDALAEAASRRLGGLLEVVPAASGMRTIGWLNTGEKDVGLAERARARGLELAALLEFTLRHFQRGQFS